MGNIEDTRSLFTYRIEARDGVAGRVHDLYVDDRRWIVRYLVADVRHGLGHRRVLISPVCARGVDPSARAIAVSLTREQIWRSPDVDTDRPVSRRHETALHEHYGLPFYWKDEPPIEADAGDPHLRSLRAIRGYTAVERDTAAGHVEEFLVDCAAWTVSDVLVARRHWLAGPRRRLPVSAIARVSWIGKAVYLDAPAVSRTA